MILQLGFKFSSVNSFVLKKLYKEEGSFSKRRGSCYFLPRKLWAAIVQRPKKLYPPPSRADFELSSPSPSSVRSRGRTLTSQPKFLGWIDNQIFLAMDNLMTLTGQPLNCRELVRQLV